MCSSRAAGNGKYALEHVPDHLRHVISAESAANDGLAYPFLSLSVYLTIEATKGEAFKKWLLVGCLCTFANFHFITHPKPILSFVCRPSHFGYNLWHCDGCDLRTWSLRRF